MTCNPFIHIDTNLINQVYTDAQLRRISASTAVGRFVESSLQQAHSNLQTTLRTFIKNGLIDSTSFPYLHAKISNIPLSVTELAEFMVEYNYQPENITSGTNYVSEDLADIIQPTPFVETLLRDMEDFYSENVAAAASGGFCSSIQNSLAKVLQFVEKLQNVVRIAGAAIAFIQDPQAAIQELIGRVTGEIQAMVAMLQNVVDQVARAILSRLQNLMAQFQNLQEQITVHLRQAAARIQSLLSEENLQALRDNIEAVAATMVAQFRELTPEVILHLVFRMCQMVQSIQQMFQNPMEVLERMYRDTQTSAELNLLGSQQQLAILEALGLPMGDYGQRVRNAQEAMRLALENRDARGPAPAGPGGRSPTSLPNIPDVPPSGIGDLSLTAEEITWLRGYNITNSPNDEYVKTTEGVHNMAGRARQRYEAGRGNTSLWLDSENVHTDTYDSGLEVLKETRPDYLIVLRRFSDRYNVTVVINSAYRSRYYNSTVDGATSSMHIQARAMDISMTAYRKDNGQSKNIASELAEWMGMHGFERMGVYVSRGFLHFDDKPDVGRYFVPRGAADPPPYLDDFIRGRSLIGTAPPQQDPDALDPRGF